MSRCSLTDLQSRILFALAPLKPPWTLVGGGALVGFHLGHRRTRNLDLFWSGRADLADLPRDAVTLLEKAGLNAAVLQRDPAFVRLLVEASDDVVTVDLAALGTPPLEAPAVRTYRGVALRVAT